MESRNILLRSYLSLLILLKDSNESSHESLKNMIREVNQTQVAKQEVLSDSLYYFDRILSRVVAL